MPPETAARYGDTPITGRHPLLEDWIGDSEPYEGRAGTARMSVIYTSTPPAWPRASCATRSTPEQSQQVAAVTLAAMGLRPGMRTLITAPMYHAAPNSQALFSLALGIELTIMPRFKPEEFLALVQSQRITHAQTVPTMFVRLLSSGDDPARATTSARSSAWSTRRRRARYTSSGG